MERLRITVEAATYGQLTDKELLALVLEPTTARRQFRRYFGVTFHAWQRARRLAFAFRDVRSGRKLIEAQLDRGYASTSGFREAFAKTFGYPPGRARTQSGLRCIWERRIETPLGTMLALADDAGLRLLEFADRPRVAEESEGLCRRLDATRVHGTNEHLENIAKEVSEYFTGCLRKFKTPIAPLGSAFQHRVWNQLCAIAPGTTRSYSDVAGAIGVAGAVRAVGRANASNIICLVIPCHRVIRSDGSLCGYRGGIWRKAWLLRHETKTFGSSIELSQPATILNVPARAEPSHKRASAAV